MTRLNLNGAEGSEDSSNRVLDNSLVGENNQGYTCPQSPNTNTPNPMPISNTPFFTPETKKFVHFHDQIHTEIENETNVVYSSLHSHTHAMSPLSPYSPTLFTTARKYPVNLNHNEEEEEFTSPLFTHPKDIHPSSILYKGTSSSCSTTPIRPREATYYGAISSPLRSASPSSDYGSSFHRQLFILAVSFLVIWSPQNLMAPNLTQVAESFGFNESQRDLYLGANLALATGVLSFPLSALLGFLVDSVSSRKRLFAGTLFLTGLSSIATGSSQTYVQLFVSRLICGGFMSGSVSVIFSLLGDLFDPKDRNIASSGLTAMMGAGILFGQVYAGTVGVSSGWQQPFLLSGFLCILCAGLVLKIVREPIRGAKEKVLQALLANGTRYDRKLTMDGFIHAMTKNTTNVILMLQGFLTNVPWGIIFTFLNDYLSQEQGLSVPEATFLVFYFGIGSAVGGILGGYLGTIASGISQLSLPLFMALSTFLGIFPFLGLLDLNLRRWPILALMLSFTGGCIANLSAVNVRPCLLNVNPPETRAAAMTTANIMIQIARGSGPSLIILLQRLHGVTRQYSFNLSLIAFWSLSSVLLLILSSSLPRDQNAMEKELAKYAESKMAAINERQSHGVIDEVIIPDDESLVSLEDRFTSFNATAAQESLYFIGDVIRGMGEEMTQRPYDLIHVHDSNGNNITPHKT